MGFYVGAGGGKKEINNPTSWPKFVRLVAAAAAKARKPRTKANRQVQAQLDNLRPDYTGERLKVKPSRQCTFIKKDGSRCRNWNLRGAQRCRNHGGYRQNPAHPGTVALYRSGYIQFLTERRNAYKQLARDVSPNAKQQAIMMLRKSNTRLTAQRALEGAKAFECNDNGIAWRRWCYLINRTPINHQQNVGITQDK